MDRWISPNHHAHITITVHLEYEGTSLALLSDLVEVAEAHTSKALTAAFKNMLEKFRVGHKVSENLKIYIQGTY